MIRNRLIGATLAAVIAAGLPGLAAAQIEQPTSPDGADWTLTGYYDEAAAELMAVPFEVEPTLRLEDSTASGSGGCNHFNGSYQIDGSSLRFDDEMSVTLALCDDPAQSIEDIYLARLGDVDGWTIDAGTLELVDDFGDVILTFEVPHILWTTSQVAALMATIEELQTELATLRRDTERLNVPKLRERIKVLEAENKKIKTKLDKLESTPAVDPPAQGSGDSTAYSSAEKVLLRGIPTRIASHCSPLRSSLPKGTKAAVSCSPNTNAVASMDYYLLEGDLAARAFSSEMDTFNVPDATGAAQTCEQGVKSQRYQLGSGWRAEGCYRTNSRAEVRFVDNATNCKKLKVGGKTVANPALYIALQGTDNDVARVHAWATKGLDPASGQLTSITQPIPSSLGTAPSCSV